MPKHNAIFIILDEKLKSPHKSLSRVLAGRRGYRKGAPHIRAAWNRKRKAGQSAHGEKDRGKKKKTRSSVCDSEDL